MYAYIVRLRNENALCASVFAFVVVDSGSGSGGGGELSQSVFVRGSPLNSATSFKENHLFYFCFAYFRQMCTFASVWVIENFEYVQKRELKRGTSFFVIQVILSRN